MKTKPIDEFRLELHTKKVNKDSKICMKYSEIFKAFVGVYFVFNNCVFHTQLVIKNIKIIFKLTCSLHLQLSELAHSLSLFLIDSFFSS